jgi:uncharacterized protein involved in exopolysaccharide biosynthesis
MNPNPAPTISGSEPTPVAGGAAPQVLVTEGEVSLIALVNALLRHWVVLVALPFAFLVLAVVYLVLGTPEFTASAVFMPQASNSGASRLSGLAAQFGINVGGASGGESLEFYSALPKSRALLQRAVESEYRVPGAGPDSSDLVGNLVQLYGVEGDTPDQQLRNTIRLLKDKVTVTSDESSGLVKIAVAAPWPALAVQIDRKLLDELNDFNLHRRQSQAGAERAFLEARLNEARHELDSAEGALAGFTDANRHYQESPMLSLQAARLQRRVDVQQQVYATLAQAYEQARIEQVRNTPVLTVIEPPDGSALLTSPLLVKTLVLAIILGLMCAVAYAFVREYLDRHRERGNEDYAEFVELRRSVLRSINPARLRGRGAGETSVR